MKVAIIGTGYVGLVTGTCLAESGNDVVCVDNNPKKVATLQSGGIPIYEPGLHELVTRNARDGRLSFRYDSPDYRGFMFASNVLSVAESPLPKSGGSPWSHSTLKPSASR